MPHLRRAGWVITILSLTAIAFATLLPEPFPAIGSHMCLVCGVFGGVNAILNVLLFVPLGLGLALSGFSGKRALLIVCALSTMVEAAQLFVIPGRYATIGDILTNTAGGALGFAAAQRARTWLLPAVPVARNLLIGWCAIWLTVQALSSFAFTPSAPDSRYYGQIARELGHFAVFDGQVLSARIGDIAITDTRLRDNDSVGRRLLSGATVAVTVVPAGLTSDIAPIVRVADAERREIVLLAQDERALLFGVRTGAAILRLRPPLFGMPGVFADRAATSGSPANDTVSLGGRYHAGVAQLTALAGGARQDRRVPISSALGWTLLLPFQWFIEDTRTERIVSWIWMAGLIVPIGYWGARVWRFSDLSASPTLAVLCFLGGAAILIGGLFFVPRTLGLSAAPVRDWLASASGIIGGVALASASRRAAQ